MDGILKNQATGTSSQEGIYRAAFPAFRVFIYGQEVSGDVIEVRVNQSGGSMDRSPGTCTIALANMGDKYILDHMDMTVIASSRDWLATTLGQNQTAYMSTQRFQADNAGEDPAEVYKYMQKYMNSEQSAEMAGVVDDFYKKLKTAQGGNNWTYGSVPATIKPVVLAKKSSVIIPKWDELYADKKDDPMYQNVFEGDTTARYVYPLTEGDCIFHPNDPIRIAFRDPFSPTVWYWMFAGFVDGFVEDRGVNQESVVTISGTDVSKLARYSFFQMNVDAVLDPAMAALFPIFQNVGSINWVPYQELFAYFSVYEILELLFFGLDSYRGTLSEMTDYALAFMSTAEGNIYLMNTATGMSADEIAALSPTENTKLLKQYLEGYKLNRLTGANLPPICNPRGEAMFKRKNEKYGVHAIFLGSPPPTMLEAARLGWSLEESMGGEHLDVAELRKLNDYIHHRVTSKDPEIMGKTAAAQAYKSQMTTPYDIITQIGQHEEDYPVGGGRVFYVAPSGLAMGTASGVLNEMMAGAGGGLHSEFKDRLTFLYDAADQIQFCFYATPKGDLVFEMPFYDFDPWMFDYEGATVSNADIESAIQTARENLQGWAEGSTKYTEDQIYEMMQMSSDLSLLTEGYGSEHAFESGSTRYASLTDGGEMNYGAYFTIDKHETYGFSNAVSDSGLKTVARCTPGNIAKQGQDLNNRDTRHTQFVIAPELAGLLGFRPASEKSPWTEVVTDEAAAVFAAIDLRRSNSEARSLNIQILPHFGLMVNRPLYWRQRNYVANIVSCQHSIAVNSSCDTAVNVNYARGWKGELQPGGNRMEVFRHFGGDMPFSYAALLTSKKPYISKQSAPKDPDAFY
jgi:hypothetical protein